VRGGGRKCCRKIIPGAGFHPLALPSQVCWERSPGWEGQTGHVQAVEEGSGQLEKIMVAAMSVPARSFPHAFPPCWPEARSHSLVVQCVGAVAGSARVWGARSMPRLSWTGAGLPGWMLIPWTPHETCWTVPRPLTDHCTTRTMVVRQGGMMDTLGGALTARALVVAGWPSAAESGKARMHSTNWGAYRFNRLVN